MSTDRDWTVMLVGSQLRLWSGALTLYHRDRSENRKLLVCKYSALRWVRGYLPVVGMTEA